MISGFWFLMIIISLLVLPLLYGMLRDFFGGNTNRFYGDELNKQRRTKKEEAYDKAHEKTARYYERGGSGGDGDP